MSQSHLTLSFLSFFLFFLWPYQNLPSASSPPSLGSFFLFPRFSSFSFPPRLNAVHGAPAIASLHTSVRLPPIAVELHHCWSWAATCLPWSEKPPTCHHSLIPFPCHPFVFSDKSWHIWAPHVVLSTSTHIAQWKWPKS